MRLEAPTFRRLAWSGLLLLGALAPSGRGADRSPSRPLDSLEDVVLGGVRQKILVLGDDARNPVLLWLHGGPGEPATLVSHRFSAELRRRVTLVHWDQRGCGLSSGAELAPSQVSEELIQSDAAELAEGLARRFGKRRIYLLGHSFGSVIGLRLAAARPDLFAAYFGVGQVIHPARSERLTREWLERRLRKEGATADLERLRNGQRLMDLVAAYGGRTHTPLDYEAIVRASPYYFDGYLQRKNAARAFCQRSIAGNRRRAEDDFFRDVPAVALPLRFFEGRHDHVPVCAPELVVEYCRAVRAPSCEIEWFERSAHLPNLEEPVRFQAALLEAVLALEGRTPTTQPRGGGSGRERPASPRAALALCAARPRPAGSCSRRPPTAR